MPDTSLNRRKFFRACLSTASMVAASPHLLARDGVSPRQYTTTLLVDEDNRPVTSASFDTTPCFIFHYPHITTPCFLIRLENPVAPVDGLATEKGDSYHWPGGVGPDNRIVAFSAICAHRLSYPTGATSFINFRPEEIHYAVEGREDIRQKQLIYCCSERSVYDPARGAKVLGGPAPQPLAAIILEHDAEQDHYHATATLGGELFNQFFEKFGFRVALEHRRENIRDLVQGSTVAWTPERYSSQRVLC